MSAIGKLFIVRHGESGWNRDGLVQGQSTAAPGLTKVGREDAIAAARELEGPTCAFVLTSDLRRAHETAVPISSHLGIPLRIDVRLRERALGDAVGRRSDQISPSESGVTGDVVTDPDAAPRGGESIRELYERIAAVLYELASEDPQRRVILVSHGGPIRVARAYVGGIPVEEMTWPSVLNGSIFEVDSGALTLGPVGPPVG